MATHAQQLACQLFGHRRGKPWEWREELEYEHPLLGIFRVGPCGRCRKWWLIGFFNDIGQP